MFDPVCERSQRASASSSSSTRWIAWMPLLFVAAFLYWSVALGLGGLSLMAASTIGSGVEASPDFGASAVEPVSGHAVAEPGNSILVHLEESAEPEDVNDNAGAAAPVDTVEASDDDAADHLPGSN
jgi:hypothetical protein